MRQPRVALVNITTQIGHHGCTLVNRRIEHLCAAAGLDIVRRLPAAASADRFDPALIDAIIVNGEGSLHHDQPEARNIGAVADIADSKGIPAFLVNSVYEANSPALGASIRRFRRSWFRDSASLAAAADHGIEGAVVPDLTLSWRPGLVAHGDRLLITDSTRRATREQLFHLARRLGAPYLSMRTQPPLLADYPDRNRRRRYMFAAKALAARYLPDSPWRAAYVDTIGAFDDFIAYLVANGGVLATGRFHGLCIALNLELPVIAVASNTAKVQALLADIGLRDRVVADTADLEGRLRGAKPADFAYSAEDIGLIRTFLSSARDRADAMFETIRADLVPD